MPMQHSQNLGKPLITAGKELCDLILMTMLGGKYLAYKETTTQKVKSLVQEHTQEVLMLDFGLKSV